MKRRLLNLLIALDQLAYVLVTFGHGSPDETLSAAAYRMELEHKPARIFRPLIDRLFARLEPDHCRRSYESERERKQLPSEYRT